MRNTTGHARGIDRWSARCRRFAACGLVAVALGTMGCQQSGTPLAFPANPMVGSTRVPPPQTGAAANSAYAPSPPLDRRSVGLPASDLMPETAPQLAAAGVRQAGHVEPQAMPNQDHGVDGGNGVAATNYVETESRPGANDAAAPSIRPQLRGMPAIDLTRTANPAVAAPALPQSGTWSAPQAAFAPAPSVAANGAAAPRLTPIQPAAANVEIGSGVASTPVPQDGFADNTFEPAGPQASPMQPAESSPGGLSWRRPGSVR